MAKIYPRKESVQAAHTTASFKKRFWIQGMSKLIYSQKTGYRLLTHHIFSENKMIRTCQFLQTILAIRIFDYIHCNL